MPQISVLALALTAALAAALAAAQESACCAARSSVTAHGDATAQVPSNITVVSLSVEVRGPTALEVQAAVGDGLTAVADYLGAQGAAVANVETGVLRLSPEFSYNFTLETGGAPSRTFSEYFATGSVSFDLVGDAAEVLDGASGLPDVIVSSITTRGVEEDVAEGQMLALERAIAAARVKAGRMAAALGKTLGDPVRVTDKDPDLGLWGSAGGARGFDLDDLAYGGAGGADGPPGTRTLHAQAMVEFSLA